MNAHANKSQENKNQAAASSVIQKQDRGEEDIQYFDDRQGNNSQHKLQDLAENTPQATQLKTLQKMANQSSETNKLAQLQSRAEKKSAVNEAADSGDNERLLKDNSEGAKESVQLAANNNNETDRQILDQPKLVETPTTQLLKSEGGSTEGATANGNSTGMPDNLKSGIERLSGMSMDHVKVHYNSDAPAQLNAHAYAQGSDIHVGPGQEKHLPHEAWHVVQQAQGRVRPTRQMKGKVNINDDTGLEKEADLMGAKALQTTLKTQTKFGGLSFEPNAQQHNIVDGVVQGLFGLFGGNDKSTEKDGAPKPENKQKGKASEEISSPVANESDQTYTYNKQYWVTEPEALRNTYKTQKQTAPEKKLSTADAETMLNKGKTKSTGMLDSLLGLVGMGTQESLLGPKLDPKKNKFYYPAMVDESSKISTVWKPIKIGRPSNPNEHFKSKYEKLDEIDGFFPITKMVAMPHDYNAFLEQKLNKKKAEEESKDQASETKKVAPPSNDASNTKLPGKKEVVTGSSSKDATEQDLVSEADKINDVSSASAEKNIEKTPTKEDELQKDVEKAKEGKLDLFKKYGKMLFTFATKFSWVRVWVNKQLQAGGSTFNELALKAKESAKSVPLLSSLTLVNKPEGTRVTPAGVTFNFGVKFPIGDKDIELSTQLFTDTQSDYSTTYIGSSAKGVAFKLGGDGDGPQFEADLGTVTHDFTSNSSSYITSSEGSANLSWGEASGNIQWKSLSFSGSQTPKLKADLSSMALGFDIYGANVNFQISNPNLVDKKLTFTDAKAILDKIKLFKGFEIGPTEVTLSSKEDKYDMTGQTKFNFSNKLVTNASGNILVSRIDEKINLTMTDGNVNVQFNDENNLSINKINYDFQENPLELSANSISSDFNLPNPIGSDRVVGKLAIDSLKINEDGFGFYAGSLTSESGLSLFNQFQIRNIVASTNHRKFEGAANLEEFPGATHVKKAGGKLSVAGGYKENSKTHFTLNEGSLKVDFFGQTVEMAGIKYDNIKEKSKVSADTASLSLDFDNPIGAGVVKASGSITKPYVSSEGFGFTSANVVNNEPINLFHALNFNKIDATVKSDGSFSGEGDFNATEGDVIQSATGKVKASRAAGAGAKTKYSLTDGALQVDFGLGIATLSGVNYTSEKPDEVSMNNGKLTTDVLGKTITLDVESAKVLKEGGFDYEKIQGTISDLSFGEAAKFTDILVAYDKSTQTLTGTTDFNLKSGFEGFTAKTAGKVTITKKGGESSLTLAGASLNLKYGKQELDLKEMNYAQGSLGVGKATLNFNVFEKQLKAQVTDGIINKDGFSYSNASLDLNASINFGIGKATIGTVTATKTPEGTTISGDGGLSVGGGTILGVSLPELSGKGVITHTFPKGDGEGKTVKELNQIGGKLPDIKLPEAMLPAGIWPFAVDIPIPVVPGVSVDIFAGLRGGISLKGTEITITKGNQEGKYIFNASLNKSEGDLIASVGAGVMVGNPLVASMMLGVEAAGGIKAKFDASFTKEIDTNETKTAFTLGKSESDYGVEGDIELSASLVLEGRALYFLKKRKEKLLGKKILGSFEGKKGQDFKFIEAKDALMSKEEHAKEAKEMLPPSFADMSEEELKLVPTGTRFSGEEAENAVQGLTTAAGSDANKKMTLLGDFLYARVDFDKLQHALSQFTGLEANEEEPVSSDVESDDPQQNQSYFTKLRKSKLVKVAQIQLKEQAIRDQISASINLKDTMINQYKVAIDAADNEYKADHLELHEIYERLNDFKRNYHSRILGDKIKGILSTAASAIKGKVGKATNQDLAVGLLADIPKVKSKRNRLDAIQATLEGPLHSE